MSSDVIKLLPDSVANQIAAGEVIQRPSSVIKELVENAIDAGATSVQIVIKDAGKTLIQVIDNGCGMSETDARMAFERHATSKIRKADALFQLHTMGFRGEALPSIAAVSEIELRTKRRDDGVGTRIVIKASKVESQEPDVCSDGTNIKVKNLFYNFVARRRFLKKDTVELSHIMHEFERLALVNTGVDFVLHHNDTLIHNMLRSPLLARIGALFGRTVERQLIPINTETSLVKISGFIGMPSGARQRNHLQYFFVNGRNMRHPYFHKAVMSCYRDLIAGDAQPNYFINFEVAADRIDVNIHPQKHEIKFEDEQMVWQVLVAAIKESLGKNNVGPAIDFEATDVPDIPPMQQVGSQELTSPVDDADPTYNPFLLNEFQRPEQGRLFNPSTVRSTPHAERPSALNNGNWEKLYDTFLTAKKGGEEAEIQLAPEVTVERQSALTDAEPTTVHEELSDDPSASMFQVKNRWIVTVAKSGLMVIDQHRAHTRILYERMLPAVRDGKMASQRLIFSEELTVDAATHAVIESSREMLAQLGFELSSDNPMHWTIAAVPVLLADADPRQSLMSIVTDLMESGSDPGEEQRGRLALSLARASAVRGNQPLSLDEMQHLVGDLFRLPTPNFTPDGLPVVQIITADRLAQMFHR